MTCHCPSTESPSCRNTGSTHASPLVNSALRPFGVAKASTGFAGVKAGMSPLSDGMQVIPYGKRVPVAVHGDLAKCHIRVTFLTYLLACLLTPFGGENGK